MQKFFKYLKFMRKVDEMSLSLIAIALTDNLTGAFQSFSMSSNMANNNLNYNDNLRVKFSSTYAAH